MAHCVVIGGPSKSVLVRKGSYLQVELWMTTTEVTVETEVLLYIWQDLVADVGGTLGLFLGFSFMTLWDGVAHLRNMGVNLGFSDGKIKLQLPMLQ